MTQQGQTAVLSSPVRRGNAVRRPTLAVLTFVRRKPLGGIGLALIIAVLTVAVFADALTTVDPSRTDPGTRLEGPSAGHWLGTDHLGRDIYSRVISGARVSAIVAPLAVVISLSIALLLGGVAGFAGGKFDMSAQRLVDVLIAFPSLLLLMSIVRVLPPPDEALDLGAFSLSASAQRSGYLIIALGVILSFGMSRVVRAAVLSVKAATYVEASRAVGVSEGRIFLRHILPNVLPVVIVLGTVALGGAILLEASTSFLGVGLPPDVPSWGGMLNEGRQSIYRSVNVSIWPGVAIALTVFGFNMLGDALRDVLDPRLRGSR